MDKQFKFRHTNEIAGALVIISLALILTGVFVAGRYQGWFEGKFKLHVMFVNPDGTPSEEGSLGLQEGGEVRIMDTQAGRIGKIMPTEDGYIQTTFIIKNRFRPFVSKGTVAKAKKVLVGVAGDSYAEIATDKSVPVEDGDTISCVKDAELMGTAMSMLKEFEESFIPTMRELLAHANNMAKDIDEGKGLAGRMISDEDFAEMIDRRLDDASDLMSETTATLVESKKLLKAMQKHWLFRKYVDQDPEGPLFLPVATGRKLDAECRKYSLELKKAQTADKPNEIARSAANLAFYKLAENEIEEARQLIYEARGELERVDKNSLSTFLFEAEIERRIGNTTKAIEFARIALDMVDRSTEKDLVLAVHVQLANLLCDAGNIEEAIQEMKKVKSLARKSETPLLKGTAEGISGRLSSLQGKHSAAAESFHSEAEFLREGGFHGKMADALMAAGGEFEKSDDFDSAANCYFRAGRTLYLLENIDCADSALSKASKSSKKAENRALSMRIDHLKTEISNSE